MVFQLLKNRDLQSLGTELVLVFVIEPVFVYRDFLRLENVLNIDVLVRTRVVRCKYDLRRIV